MVLTSLTMASNRGARSSASSSGEPPAMPFTPLAYTTGKSHCSSVAHSSQNRSNVESMTKSGLQDAFATASCGILSACWAHAFRRVCPCKQQISCFRKKLLLYSCNCWQEMIVQEAKVKINILVRRFVLPITEAFPNVSTSFGSSECHDRQPK